MHHLAGTTDKGVIAKHNRTFDLKVWADADFAQTFRQEPSGSTKSAKSRCRHVVTFRGVPLVWKSQMILKICMSATHAECAGPSNSLQMLTPMCDLIKDTLEQLKLTSAEKPKMLFKIFEGNQAAHHLAINHQLLVRTKHFAVKRHVFQQFVCHAERNPGGWLDVEKCSTDLTNADCPEKSWAELILMLTNSRFKDGDTCLQDTPTAPCMLHITHSRS